MQALEKPAIEFSQEQPIINRDFGHFCSKPFKPLCFQGNRREAASESK